MIKRALLPRLISHLNSPEISLLIGPRQSGKTTLMRLLIDHLEVQNKACLYLNYDLDKDRQHFKTQTDLLTQIHLEIGDTGFVFLDEIQRKENAGLFLKGLYDMNLPYKFVVSGSGSLELKEKIGESLAGRKQVFMVYPLSFYEFINYKTASRYEDRLQEFLQADQGQGQKLLIEYLSFGGYPKVVLAETLEEKKTAMADIFESYLEKDISSLLRLKKTEDFSNLVRLLASQMGQLLNYSRLSSTLGLSEKTVKHYLWYLTKTYIGEKISPFTHRFGKEIVKSPIFYFTDLGLVNYANNCFYLHDLSALGFHFQHLVYHTLRDMTSKDNRQIHYWRTKDGAEVDFVVDKGQEIVPFEAKVSWERETLPAPLVSFMRRYKCQKGFVITPKNLPQLPTFLNF